MQVFVAALALVLAIGQCGASFLSLGSSNSESNKKSIIDNAVIKDTVSDLSWLRVVPAKTMSNQNVPLQVSASAFRDSILPNVYSSNLLSMNSVPGKRRLDIDESVDIAALASMNGRAGYKSYMNGRVPMMGDDLGATTTGNRAVESNQLRRSSMEFNDNYMQFDRAANRNARNHHRRHKGPVTSGKKRQQQQGMAVFNRQESRKKPTKNLVSKSNRDRGLDDDDDEFKESNRRSSQNDDGDDDDESSEEAEEPQERSIGGRKRLNVAGSRSKKSKRRQQEGSHDSSSSRGGDEVDGDETSSLPNIDWSDEGNDTGDEDIDSSNLSELSAESNKLLREQSVMKKRAPLKVKSGKMSNMPDEMSAINEASSASHVRNSATDLQAAAGHHHGHHGHYYQYVEVPKKKSWKFGFKRGNHKHEIMRHEKGHKHKFHSAFKWHANEKCKKKKHCKSVGKMTWEYKHAKKHHR